ncbi:MAG: hypothetical protein ACJ76F_11560, partial [Bacteroidia bacterium]
MKNNDQKTKPGDMTQKNNNPAGNDSSNTTNPNDLNQKQNDKTTHPLGEEKNNGKKNEGKETEDLDTKKTRSNDDEEEKLKPNPLKPVADEDNENLMEADKKRDPDK